MSQVHSVQTGPARSANRTQTDIPEYKETVGKRIERPSGQEAGDPARLAEAVIKVTESENPPLRLLLGRDAYEIASARSNSPAKRKGKLERNNN